MIEKPNIIALRRSVALLLLLAGYCFAQNAPDNSIHDVDVCELLQRPALFDSKLVRFRGRLIFQFEGDHVDDRACNLPFLHPGIWWELGNEAVWGNDADAAHVREITTPILKDAAYKEFDTRTHARLSVRPDGESCDSHRTCALFDVDATFIGRFFAGDAKSPQIPGYGHMGCCHLLVIEQISEVESTRTPVPSDDGKFNCGHETWEVEDFRRPVRDLDAHLAASRDFLAEQMRLHGDQPLVEEMSRELSPLADITGTLRWTSRDLLTTYRIAFPQSDRHKRKSKQSAPSATAPLMLNVTREVCEQVRN